MINTYCAYSWIFTVSKCRPIWKLENQTVNSLLFLCPCSCKKCPYCITTWSRPRRQMSLIIPANYQCWFPNKGLREGLISEQRATPFFCISEQRRRGTITFRTKGRTKGSKFERISEQRLHQHDFPNKGEQSSKLKQFPEERWRGSITLRKCSTSKASTSKHSTNMHSTSECSTSKYSTSKHSTSKCSTSKCSTSKYSASKHSTSKCSTTIFRIKAPLAWFSEQRARK